MRTAPRIAAGVAAALALFVIFFLLLPEFINVKPMKAHVIEALSRSAGVRVQAARIDISFIPRPSITLIGGTISGQVSGGFESLSIYPRILPLFRGEARIAGLDVKGPDIRVPLPEKSKIAQGVRPFSLRALEDEVTPIVSRALIRAPGLVVSVEKGRLTLFEGNDQAFRFGDMDGRLSLRGKRAEITIACTSNIWGRASLRGWLDPKGFKGEARLELMRFVADPVVQRLFPSMDPRLQDTLGDLTVRLRVDGADALSAEVESRMDRSTLRKGDEILALQQVRLKGAFRQDGGKTTISVSDFESLYPALGMSGQLALDPASSHATADVCSRYMDVGGARKIALFFAGRVPVLQRVFDVVREGRISGINLSAHGDSLLTMMEMTHIAGQGTLTGGRIILPESGLPIDGIKGDMVLAHGFLEGTNLAARMGESRGTKGKLRLELGKDSGFRLDIDVNADLAQLPFYMRRLAPTSAFVREMGMVRSPRGTAEGRVIFDSLQKKPLQTIVDVPSFTLHAGYDRFPQPMDVRGGRFHYDSAGRQIAVQNLSGKAGASSFSGLSAQLALGQEPYLAITS
ncbi:MAG: hypothetical protein ABSC19_20580, partial [Syntrophorhabdales bacterium]